MKNLRSEFPIKKEKILPDEVAGLQTQYSQVIENDPRYSLDVDPENKYHMPELQKEFIRYYVQFKNVPLACKLCNISEEEGQAYYFAYDSQKEIRRINLAMYHRQFATRLLTLDEVGGYLTSVLVDENVSMSDRLSTKDKLKVAQMIIDLNELKRAALSDPIIIENVDVSEQIKDLSVKSIKQLLDTAGNQEVLNEKLAAIDKLNPDNTLSGEEVAYLKTLPLEKLLELVEKGNQNENS